MMLCELMKKKRNIIERVTVFLDGEEVKGCVEFNTDKGYVITEDGKKRKGVVNYTIDGIGG